ncbi:MAG: tRNA (guanosine(37)-N1)-methyltransferase TrmD [Pseudomonadota bacterium]|nr:tRNA (guanosine(37)-N1)-methyltransferase TrmD [Gammaproteobacteria bacterium]MEC7886150.1 tRNA (guanosine(37)-N1)-methyltransferase TrmD [Pseudomonadota bacterium]|tara:strand:+ start:937 stop:1617 length:681 start_codon:yes stop_codon:yes gene_type:complete
MNIFIVCVFPEIIEAFKSHGVISRAIEKSLVTIHSVNIRDYSDKSGHIDDKPYGGGPGMVIRAEPLIKAVRSIKDKYPSSKCIYLSPKGKKLDQKIIKSIPLDTDLILVSGRYEGVDQRFIDLEVDEEWSIGDYVLSGGEVAACVVSDAIIRLIPGCLGDPESNKDESFDNDLLEYPHYTRPETIDGMSVPDVLLSGNHQEIKKWRQKEAVSLTEKKRKDLMKKKL